MCLLKILTKTSLIQKHQVKKSSLSSLAMAQMIWGIISRMNLARISMQPILWLHRNMMKKENILLEDIIEDDLVEHSRESRENKYR